MPTLISLKIFSCFKNDYNDGKVEMQNLSFSAIFEFYRQINEKAMSGDKDAQNQGFGISKS